jgi:hypothetical protein
MGLFLCFLQITVIASANKGYEITKSCRNNIRMLNEALKKYVEENPNAEIPHNEIVQYKQMFTMILTKKYIPDAPVLPTLDCGYNLIYKGPGNFRWFCSLHGTDTGDMRLTFPYHEYEFTAYFEKSYMTISKYQKHYDDIMRWTAYTRTLRESITYHYSRNPTTTIGIVVVGVLFVLFVARSLFW